MNRWQKKLNVLIADDFAEHCIVLACAMRQSSVLQVAHSVTTNSQAVRYLFGKGIYSNRVKYPYPDVLITELGMPCLEAVKLLGTLDSEEFPMPLRIVLTGSPCAEDRREAEQIGVDAYFTKPEDFHGMVDIVHKIERLTLETVRSAPLKLHVAKAA